MSEMIKLTDTSRYVRDLNSKGLVSTDIAGLGAYRAQRRSSEQVASLMTDINSLKEELRSVKDTLLELVGLRSTIE